MSERERLTYDPDPNAPSFVNDLVQRLDELVGPTWAGFHLGDSRVSDAALFARWVETDSGRWVLAGVMLLGDAITAEQLRQVPVAALENSANLGTNRGRFLLDEQLPKLPKLEREAGIAPEDFSRRVAEHYRLWAAAVPHPASAMAVEAGVKLPTMHSWIREARLRGFLPPGRRGKGTT